MTDMNVIESRTPRFLVEQNVNAAVEEGVELSETWFQSSSPMFQIDILWGIFDPEGRVDSSGIEGVGSLGVVET